MEDDEERERPSDEFPAEPFSEHLVRVRVRGAYYLLRRTRPTAVMYSADPRPL